MPRVLPPNLYQNVKSYFFNFFENSAFGRVCQQIIIKLIMHSFLSSRLRWDMWRLKRLPVFEKFGNGRLPNSVRLPFDKMGSKSITDLPTRKPPRTTVRNEGNFEFARMLVCVIEPRSGSFLLSSQGTFNAHGKCTLCGAVLVYLMF